MDSSELRTPSSSDGPITLVRWHVPDGGRVAVDEPVCELETEKATVDFPSPHDGTVVHLVPDGTVLALGQVFGRIVRSK